MNFEEKRCSQPYSQLRSQSRSKSGVLNINSILEKKQSKTNVFYFQIHFNKGNNLNQLFVGVLMFYLSEAKLIHVFLYTYSLIMKTDTTQATFKSGLEISSKW